MIPTLAPLANHLWQSTLFAVAAATLAFTLRKNRAQTRHIIWLIASLKFLVPFSWLISLGSHIGWSDSVSAPPPNIPIAVRQIGQPFASSESFYFTSNAVTSHPFSHWGAILLATWTIGLLVVFLSWLRRWLQVRAAVGNSKPLPVDAPVKVLSSPSLMEPGVFGILRPVLLLPAGIENRLPPSHFKAILAHEFCHIRRRDNLLSLLHLLVEAVFWFHPLVWWIGARLIDERERACDEEVLRLGNEPAVYVESILKVCQFYLESPIACVAGVTGSDLKKRVVRIMTEEIVTRLNVCKKLLISFAAVAAVTLPLAVGAIHVSESSAQQPSENGPEFEVASIKPAKLDLPGKQAFFVRMDPGGRFMASAITAKSLIEMAYDVKDSQISAAPSWLDSERYEIDAKPDEATSAAINKLPPDQRMPQVRKMLQALLAERFKLALGHETEDLPAYVLVVAKNGPKLQKSTFKPPDTPPDSRPNSPPGQGPMPRQGIRMTGRGEITVTYVDLPMFANLLSRIVGRIVVDKTDLPGKYDFTLKWTPEDGEGPMMPGPRPDGAAPPPESAGPSIFTALQEQLGLKLNSQKAATEVLVIQHVARPTEN